MPFLSVGVKKPIKLAFIIAICVTLVATAFLSYFNYSELLSSQLERSAIQSQLDELSTQNSNFQKYFNELQNNYSSFQSMLADLQTRLDNLQSEYDALKSQHENLQEEYAEFVLDYQRLRPIASFSYLVFTDGKGNYFAENGTTRTIDYSGRNATRVGQNCIDALSESGGRIMFSGTVNLDGPLVILNESGSGLLEICGFGPSTQLVPSLGSDGIQILGGKAFGYGGLYHVIIRDLVLTGSKEQEGTFMNRGIYIRDSFDISLQNIMVFYANKAGIFIEDSANVKLDNIYVEGCSGTEYGGVEPLSGVGIWLSGSKDCYLQKCYSDTNEIGFLFDSNTETENIPRNIFLTQCEATLSSNKGISISQVDGFVISDSLIEGSYEDGIILLDSCRGIIENTFVLGNVGNGIVITSQDKDMIQSGIRIKTCIINGNGKNGVGVWAKNNKTISQVNIEECQILNSGSGARGNPNQPELWDGVNISNNITTGGNCRFITIEDCSIGNSAGATPTQNYGIHSLQNSDYIQVFRNKFFQNIAGDFTLVGYNNYVEDNWDIDSPLQDTPS